ncbi:MAG: hypothetical protein V3T39_06545 [Gammaproteobacteria bacterium]
MENYKNLFTQYCQAFNAQDTDRIAELYVFPFELVSEGKRYEFATREVFLDNLYKRLGIYRDMGVNSILFRLVEEETDNKSAMIHWTMLNAENRIIIDFNTRYHFAKGQLRINCVEVYDEPEKLRKLLA